MFEDHCNQRVQTSGLVTCVGERCRLIQPCLKTIIYAIKEYKQTPGPNLKRENEATELKDFGIKPTSAEKETFKSRVK